MTRLYRALSEINQAIVRLENESLLFPLVCDVCVEFGGMELAWIGIPDMTSDLMTEVASRGKTNYIQGIVISINPETPEGNGPTGLCWRNAAPVLINDYKSAVTRPWHVRAKAFGFGSGGAFPIVRKGKMFAVLSVYHCEENAFDSEVIGLIDELTRDISFALDNFDRQRDIDLARQALYAKEKHFRAYFECAMVGMVAVRCNGSWIEANKRFIDMVGYSLSELTSMKSDDITHPEDKSLSSDFLLMMNQNKTNYASFDKRYIHKNGSIIYAHITSGVVMDEDRNVEYLVSTIENTTDKVLAEEKLTHFAKSIDESLNEIYLFAEDTLKFEWISHGAQQNLGYSQAELLEMTPVDIKPDFTESSFRQLLEPLRIGIETQLVFVTRHVRKNGTFYPVEVRLQCSLHFSGNMFIAIILDISERLAIDARLTTAARLFTHSREGIIILDDSNNVVAVNAAFTLLSGYQEFELVGLHATEVVNRIFVKETFEDVWFRFATQGLRDIEVLSARKDGSTFINHLSMTDIVDLSGNVTGYAWFCLDVTEERANLERINHAARTDALTSLMNRNAFTSAIKALPVDQKTNCAIYSLILLNLDNFKQLNEFHGYQIGDQALIEIARRLSVFESDGLLVCRVGGDEFAMAFPGDQGIASMRIAALALDSIVSPLNIDDHNFRVSASVGIACSPNDAGDLETLFRLAGSALTVSKQAGRNRARLFDAVLNESYARTLLIQDSLRNSLDKNEFYLAYQPLVSLVDGKIYGCEALLRWTHADLGQVSPCETIRVAEDTGFILELGDWILDTAVCQLAQWRAHGLLLDKLAINVSAFQFLHGTLVETLTRVLERYEIPGTLIDLEITETVAVENVTDVIRQIEKLRSLGVTISIDDFGTGYSSLSYLRKFDINSIKIDRSFVEDVCCDIEVHAIVEAIIRIAKVFGFDTIAEGVENMEQLEMLRNLGCERIQGYLMSPPLPEGEVAEFIRNFELPKMDLP